MFSVGAEWTRLPGGCWRGRWPVEGLRRKKKKESFFFSLSLFFLKSVKRFFFLERQKKRDWREIVYISRNNGRERRGRG